MKSAKFLLPAAALAAALFVSGCATTIDYGDPTSAKPLSTEFGSSDLQQIATAMVDSMLATAPLPADGSRPVLIIDPVKNKTMQHIDTESITDSIRTRLIRSGRFTFQDRTTEASLQQEIAYQQGAAANPVQFGQQVAAEYMLTANLSEIEQKFGRVTDVYYKFTLNLRNLRTGTLDWADEKEIRKTKVRPIF